LHCRSFGCAEEGPKGSFADEAVNPCVGLVAIRTCGYVGVQGGAWAFVASRQKVRPDGVCVAAGCLDSSVQRVEIDDLMANML
jgi:hypothetical protein